MDNNLEKKGRIFNIQKYSIYDGDGIRTLIFFKGCNICCPWCANPEGISRAYQVMFSHDKCVNCGNCVDICPAGVHIFANNEQGQRIHQVDRSKTCIGCRQCEQACVAGALDIMGQEVTVKELLKIIMQDVDFYHASGGGVTLGGGELSLQADFAAALLTECKKMMISTAIETNGTTDLTNYQKLAACTDTFLFDIKHIDTHHHKTLFGIGNEGVKRNLEYLLSVGAHIVVRMPLVRGYNDSFDAITAAIEYVMKLAPQGNISRIDILPYHQLGKSKYEKLDMIYPVKQDPSYSDQELNQLAAFFQRFDFDIRLVRH